jgi:hypothetical protein
LVFFVGLFYDVYCLLGYLFFFWLAYVLVYCWCGDVVGFFVLCTSCLNRLGVILRCFVAYFMVISFFACFSRYHLSSHLFLTLTVPVNWDVMYLRKRPLICYLRFIYHKLS